MHLTNGCPLLRRNFPAFGCWTRYTTFRSPLLAALFAQQSPSNTCRFEFEAIPLTEIEVIEALNLHATNGMSGFAIYLTLTFAYLTAIYVVGAKLTGAQTVLLSLLYLAWSTSFAMVAITHLQSLESIVLEYPSLIRARMWFAPWSVMGTTITLAGMAVCVYFLREVRVNDTTEEHEST